MGTSKSPPAVEVLDTGGPIPMMARGTLASHEGDTLLIDLHPGTQAPARGRRVVVNIRDGATARVIAEVTGADGARLELRARDEKHRERRGYPRLHGSIPLRAQRATDIPPQAIEAWLAGGPAPDQIWLSPDTLMNFSVSGLAFNATPDLLLGDLLLIELGIRDSGERWRCTARVVWSGTKAGTHHIAIRFEHLPAAASEALTELTLTVQAAYI